MSYNAMSENEIEYMCTSGSTGPLAKRLRDAQKEIERLKAENARLAERHNYHDLGGGKSVLWPEGTFACRPDGDAWVSLFGKSDGCRRAFTVSRSSKKDDTYVSHKIHLSDNEHAAELCNRVNIC